MMVYVAWSVYGIGFFMFPVAMLSVHKIGSILPLRKPLEPYLPYLS